MRRTTIDLLMPTEISPFVVVGMNEISIDRHRMRESRNPAEAFHEEHCLILCFRRASISVMHSIAHRNRSAIRFQVGSINKPSDINYYARKYLGHTLDFSCLWNFRTLSGVRLPPKRIEAYQPIVYPGQMEDFFGD